MPPPPFPLRQAKGYNLLWVLSDCISLFWQTAILRIPVHRYGSNVANSYWGVPIRTSRLCGATGYLYVAVRNTDRMYMEVVRYKYIASPRHHIFNSRRTKSTSEAVWAMFSTKLCTDFHLPRCVHSLLSVIRPQGKGDFSTPVVFLYDIL